MAAMVPAATDEIPAAAERAHELLDMVERLDCPPGLYRFADLALEYQLTRPVAHLTGLDPTQGSGLWQLRSAMIARSCHTRPPRHRRAQLRARS